MSKQEIILDTDPDIVQQKEVTVWVGKDGFQYTNERAARYANSTHSKCECGNIMSKGWAKCPECITKMNAERYWSLPLEVWDKKKPICTFDGEHYFFSEDELQCFIDDNPDINPLLVICEPNYASEIPLDFWEDAQTEDSDLPDELVKKLVEFNKFLATLEPLSYSVGKIRTQYIR